jgi:hypothetical protein
MANIIQQLEDLKEWGQDPTRYARRLAFRSPIPTMGESRTLAQGGRIGYDPGGAVRKNELTKVLTDANITPSQSNFSKVMTDLDVKKDTKHPLHRKTQPIYVEPTKKELIIMKKKWDKHQLQSFHTGPGREAYELREKRIIELLKKKDKTLSELDATIKKEFGTSSKTTIIKLKKELKIKLPDAREKGPLNVKTAKIIKDLNILKNSEELNNLILKPDFSLMGDLPELEKIATEALPKTTADPVRRVGQLLLAYSGEDPELQKYVGEVSDDLVKASNVVKTKMNKSNRLLSTLQKIAAEKRAAIEIGKPPAFFGSQRKRLNEIINSFKKGLGIEVDEIRAVGGAKAKTSVYDLFVQGVKDTVNQKKGETLDRLTQTAEIDLQNEKKKGKKIKIAETYNEEVKKFVENANKNLKSGQLPVRAFEISFDKPSETIKNKKAYTQYKDMFDDVHTKHGYSFKVPQDVMTSEQAKIFLKTDKGQAQLLKQVDLGSSRLYSFPGVFAEALESPLAKKAGKLARTLGVEFEAAFIGVDFINNLSKGIEPGEALQKSLQLASFDFYKGGNRKTIENIKKVAEELGFDPKVMDSLIKVSQSQLKITDFEKKINNNLQAMEDLKEKDVTNPYIKSQIKAFENMNRTMQANLDKEIEIGGNLFNTYRTNVKKSKGSFKFTDEDINQSFTELQTAAFTKLERERIKSAKTKSTQVDVEAGAVGDVIQNALAGFYTYPKYAFDVVNPFSPLPKMDAWKTEGMKEKERIIDMQKRGTPGELYRYNIARGFDIDQPLTGQAYETMIEEQPYLGLEKREDRAGGGIAGIRRPNAIPPVSGPMPQGGGLSTMFNRVKPW